MNNDDTAGDLAAIIFNALSSSDRPVTFECAAPGLFVYTTALDNGFTISAYFNAVAGGYLACRNNGIIIDFTEFLAAAIFHKLADRHARQNLSVNLYEALYR